MESLLLKLLLEESPSLIAMLTMVLLFVRYIKHRDELAHEIQKETNSVIRKTSESLGQVHEALLRMNGH